MSAIFSKLAGAGIIFFLCVENLWTENFGQNKIISQKFSWQVSVSSHFHIHYYPAAENIVPLAIKYLEDSYENIQQYLPIERSEVFPVFLYFGHNDFEQTNIADIGEGTGGITEGTKNRLVVGHLGSRRYLRYVLTHELVHEFEFSILLSGFWRSARLLKLYIYPNWLMEGLAEYTAGEIDPYDREMYLRDIVANNKIIPLMHLYNFNHLLPHQITPAYKESEMLIRFIIAEYGEEALFRLLKHWRAAFDSNTVLLATLGLDQETLEFKFREFLQEKFSDDNAFDQPENYQRLTLFKNKFPQFSESPVFSPDGKKLYFLSDFSGINEIYEYDFSRKQYQPIIGQKNLPKLTSINRNYPNLTISRDGQYLTFIARDKQQDCIYLYHFPKTKLQKINLPRQFYSLANPVFTPDNESIIFSGLTGIGHNIYEYNLKKQTLTVLVADGYDNIQPAISPDGKILVYSSERPDGGGNYFYQLYYLELTTASPKTEKLLELAGDQISPVFSPNGKSIIFVSPNKKKIRNLYIYDLTSKNISALTNVRGGIFTPAFSPDGTALAFSLFDRGEKNIYSVEWEKLSQKISPTPVNSPPTLPEEEIVLPEKNFQPYRFRFSTDLFFPFLYYSSLDGLLLANYWQASDFLGNHQLSTYLAYASGSDYLNGQIQYALLPWRTPIYLTVGAQRYFRDWTMTDKYQNILTQILVAYPFNRYQRLEFSVGIVWEKETLENQVLTDTRQDILGISYVSDTSIRKYLEINSGDRLRLLGYFSLDNFGGNYRYQSYSGNWEKYLPLWSENILIIRNYFKSNYDQNAPLISLGGYEKISGLSPDKITSRQIYIFGLEYRQVLFSNINYYMWYLFPDFFFKTLSVGFFSDIGSAETSWHGDWGINLRCYTFILQTFPFALELRYARPLEESPEVWYFIFGAPF